MIQQLEYTTFNGVSVCIPFHDQVTVIGGESSTGKSFIKDTAPEHYNDEIKTVIEIFDYKRTVDVNILQALKDKLIIIDNADVLLSENKAVCEHINRDKYNQYLLFMRSENDIDVSIDNYAELKSSGKMLTAVYEYR